MTAVMLPTGERISPRVDPRWVRGEATPRGERARTMLDEDVPWWAIALLDLKGDEYVDQRRVRRMMEIGRRPHVFAPRFWDLWGELIERAKSRVMTKTLEQWLEQAYRETDLHTWEGGPVTDALREAALRSVRSFGQIIGLADDEGFPIVFKDFHVKSVRAMRCFEYASILLPFEYGKSYLTNIVVPLMDYAEWNDATEGRIYWNDTHVSKWVKRLMGLIERNERLHQLFPWVAKPVKGDPGWRLWGVKGFSIHGRSIDDKAFEPLTANQFSVGNRFARVGGDDWVNSANAQVLTIQDRLADYWKSGPETFKQKLQRRSPYGTAWPSVFLCGTLFDVNDVNSQIHAEYKDRQEKGDLRYKALRFDCFTDITERATIWPERKSVEYMKALRVSLTTRIFNMRCRNWVSGSVSRVFPRAVVLRAEFDGHERPPMQWGQVPERLRGAVIGFDPGSGRITKESKNPAFFVYGWRDARPLLEPGLLRDSRFPITADVAPGSEPDIYHHGIEWGRMEGMSFTVQCDFLIAKARHYKMPVAFENNAAQEAYGNLIEKIAPDVRLFAHRTGPGGGDPKAGVEQFEPLFKNERMVLHCAGAPLETVLALRHELTQWKGRYTDIVMAMWIARYQSEEHNVDDKPQLRLQTPVYLRRLRSFRR